MENSLSSKMEGCPWMEAQFGLERLLYQEVFKAIQKYGIYWCKVRLGNRRNSSDNGFREAIKKPKHEIIEEWYSFNGTF